MSDTNEEIVDSVLRGMRDAAPPDGMESRIVGALHHRASMLPVPSRSGWRPASIAGGACVAGVLCVLLFTAHRAVPSAAVSRSTAIPTQATSGAIPPVATAAPKPIGPIARRPRGATASPPPGEAWLAVSYPAPPMPLTDQEKLLLRLAHKGDLVQLAMLDPAQREANYAYERAQVQTFFAPPKQEITSEK